jgi:hypothetical protein
MDPLTETGTPVSGCASANASLGGGAATAAGASISAASAQAAAPKWPRRAQRDHIQSMIHLASGPTRPALRARHGAVPGRRVGIQRVWKHPMSIGRASGSGVYPNFPDRITRYDRDRVMAADRRPRARHLPSTPARSAGPQFSPGADTRGSALSPGAGSRAPVPPLTRGAAGHRRLQLGRVAVSGRLSVWWRLSGCRGSPSSGIGSHGAAYLTNWRALGRMPGSSSKVPMRMPIGSAWLGLRAKSDEPHVPQNHFSPPPSGFQTRSWPSPAMIRNVSAAGWALGEAAAPLLRWQRRQWQ